MIKTSRRGHNVLSSYFVYCKKFSSSTDDLYVVRSRFPDVQIPKVRLHEFVWQNIKKWPDKLALECGVTGEQFTYKAARERSRKIAIAMQHVLKLKKGDSFAIVGNNCPEYALITLAASEAGAVVTTINPVYSAGEMAKQLRDAMTQLVICIPSKVKVVREATKLLNKDLPIVVYTDLTDSSKPAGTVRLEDAVRDSTKLELESHPWDEDDNVLLPYSSGTTGLSKGVQICHRTIVADLALVLAPKVTPWKCSTSEEQDHILVQLPMFHGFGLSLITYPSLTFGAKLVTYPSYQPETFIDAIHKHKVTLLFLVPPMAVLLANHPYCTAEKLSSVRTTFCAAAPLGHKDVEKLKGKAPHALYIQAYGLTETSPVTHMGIPELEHKYGSCGVLLPNTSAKVIDVQTGKSLPPRKNGEIWIKGPQVMKGYLNQPEATKNTIVDGGWLRSGDIGYYDEEGSFYIVDRIKELIKVKGLQVAPAELEEILRSNPKVSDAAVIGVPDERAGELPRAYVVLKQGETAAEEEIQTFVHSQVAPFKQLKGGVVFLDAIPKTSTGKLLRRKLKDDVIKNRLK